MSALALDHHDLLALHLVPGLGPRLTAALLERFGSAPAVREASVEQLSEIAHIGPKLARQFYQAMREVDVPAELALMEKHRTSLLRHPAPPYPASVASIPNPPLLLYVRGTIEPGDAQAVAIVGSRQCTGYGVRMAERLAAGLARAGYIVVSGLARGIDGAAHRAALHAGGRTLAVLAGGLSKIYPPEHDALAGEVESAGALLSESAMRMEPMAGMFPARNRIISGLSRAVVIVEAAARSGALITAEHAAEQGRMVLAVPGAVESEASQGTNTLIREGAILCRSVDDILQELQGVPLPIAEATTSSAAPPPPPTPVGLDETQQRVWDCLAEGPRYFDQLAQQLQLAVPPLTTALMTLEMKRIVRRLPGNRYERYA